MGLNKHNAREKEEADNRALDMLMELVMDNPTPRQLAERRGLTKQRISQILIRARRLRK